MKAIDSENRAGESTVAHCAVAGHEESSPVLPALFRGSDHPVSMCVWCGRKKATSRTPDGKMPNESKRLSRGIQKLSWPDYRVKQCAKFLPEPFAWLGSTQCQFLRVRMLTPSFTASAPWERLVFMRYSVSNSASDWGLFWQGCESTLTALITRWQKGFRNHPFRQPICHILQDGAEENNRIFGLFESVRTVADVVARLGSHWREHSLSKIGKRLRQRRCQELSLSWFAWPNFLTILRPIQENIG
jgi:hypothetical protein